MSEIDAAQSASCAQDDCDRDVDDEDHCYWHREENGKEPLNDDSPVERIPYDLVSAYLERANLTDASLKHANLTDANLRHADLTDADLRRADLTNADLLGTNLINAELYRSKIINADLLGTDLTGARLTNADLTDTNLSSANLSGVDLSGVDFTGAHLPGIEMSNPTANRQTKFGSRLPEWFSNMTAHARAYHELRTKLSREGYDKPTRDLYVLEQKARTRAAFPRDPITFFGGLLSGLLTGYGVRPRRVFLSTTFLIALTTLWFSLAGVVYEGWNTTYELLGFQLQTGSLHYSVVTFVTSPPHPPQSPDLLTNLFVTVETYLGTVLTLLLGYTLSNRSRV